MPEIEAEVASLPRGTVVLFGLFFADSTGQGFVTAEAVRHVTAAASVPVYVHTETLLGTGAVGGYMTDVGTIGREAAEVALDVLGGTAPSALPIDTTKGFAFRADARAMARWGYLESRLPAGTVVLNHQATLWEQYRYQVIAASVVIVLQSMMLIALGIEFLRRRRAEEGMRAARTDLARASRFTTMGEMTASIAHEVNQPLAAIVSNASAGLRWIGRSTPDIDETRAALGRINRDAMRAAEVIATVRGMFGNRQTSPERLDLSDLVRGVLALTAGEAERQNVTVRTAIEPGLPSVQGDRVQLQQVVLNLTINAIEAMQDGAKQRQLTVRLARLGDHLALRVADTGSGIDPDARERIFDAFYSTKPKGMGMGLSICRSIIEAHGGRLDIEQSDGRGTVFLVTLPFDGSGSAGTGGAT